MKYLAPLLILLQSAAYSQSREEFFDYQFKPAKAGGYYFVKTEKTDSGFLRQAWYLSQKSLYMKGWYQDEACSIPQGQFISFHPNQVLRQTGRYVNGQKEGAWLYFDEDGMLTDSVNYVEGKRKGISYRFHKNGYLADSTHFDGLGNGTEVRWYDDGTPAAAGYWMQDTLKKGRWKYYHRNGKLMATEDYDEEGKQQDCHCYDETGRELEASLCPEQEASVDKNAWQKFLEKNLGGLIAQKAREGIMGTFTVVVRFVVREDGSIAELTPLTNYGYGIEEGVLKIFRKSPKWSPGRVHGKAVKSYHTQPITFIISSD